MVVVGVSPTAISGCSEFGITLVGSSKKEAWYTWPLFLDRWTVGRCVRPGRGRRARGGAM